MIHPDALNALHQSRTLDLYHLSLALGRLLDDPKRILEVRARLHRGQSVRFVDHRATGAELALRPGLVVDLQDRHAVIQDAATRERWKVPYVAVEPGEASPGEASSAAPAEPPAAPSRDAFRVGDRVAFDDRHLQARIGVITRINARTATIDCDGHRWRVSFQLLRQVRDIAD